LDRLSIRLAVGQEWSINLPTSGSTGYLWEWSIEGDQDAISVAAHSPEGPKASPGEPQGSISGSEIVFVVTGRRPGSAMVRFQFRRPWQKDAPPAQETVAEVEVTGLQD